MPDPNIPPELQGWEKLDEIAGGDNVPTQNKIKIETAWKTVLAMSNLGQSIFSMQKVLGKRLDELNKRLDEASKSADKQSNRMFWLTVALVIATIVQATAAILIILVKDK